MDAELERTHHVWLVYDRCSFQIGPAMKPIKEINKTFPKDINVELTMWLKLVFAVIIANFRNNSPPKQSTTPTIVISQYSLISGQKFTSIKNSIQLVIAAKA